MRAAPGDKIGLLFEMGTDCGLVFGIGTAIDELDTITFAIEGGSGKFNTVTCLSTFSNLNIFGVIFT
tara:strand:- start:62 stop:262 length:201 start_codon:yes stop_codon:yes gene_type:complete